ncbi:MAG TPA: hypothetical protein VEA59_05365 [Patescibacteria group bacterium]|nr:hypothetical protein [Patescibacteria group bacterium]
MYTELSAEEGRIYLPSIVNLIFKPKNEPNFFVQPWENHALRDCAEFQLGREESAPDQLLFFVTDPELASALREETEELFLFGAYNQITVCQMRARGTVTLLKNYAQTEQLKLRLRAAIEVRIDSKLNKLTRQEARERFEILEEGSLFCFRVNSYAYSFYDRG